MRFFWFFIVFAFLLSCHKDTVNPYDDPSLNPPNNTDSVYFDDPTSFAALQNNIFSPYCADNPGWHDGTFEPDFRTIESSYSTLVYQPVIKENPNNTSANINNSNINR